MLREMFSDSYYNFKEYLARNPDMANKFGALAIRISERLDKIEKRHEAEKQRLYKQIEMLIEKAGDTTTTTTYSNTTNIKLNRFGKEDISYITNGMMDKMIKYPHTMIPRMIENTHFHKEHPENKNIQITNKKENLIKVYDGNKWKYEDKKETIKSLVDNNYDRLDIYCEEEGRDKFETHERKRYEEFQNQYDNEKLSGKLLKEVEMVIINNTDKN